MLNCCENSQRFSTFFYGQATVPMGVYQAIAAGSDHSLRIRHDDTLTGWGDNTYGQIDVPRRHVCSSERR